MSVLVFVDIEDVVMNLGTPDSRCVLLAEDKQRICGDQIPRLKGNGREQAATVKGRLANLNG